MDTFVNNRLRAKSYLGRGVTVYKISGDSSAAILDFNQAITLDPYGAGILAQENIDAIRTGAVQVGIMDEYLVKLPQEYALDQNYPNPFNPRTVIQYQIPKASHITLKIYNVMGQTVQTLVNETKEPGYYEAFWDGRDAAGEEVASGIYLYRLESKDFVAGRKFLLMR